MPPRGAAARAGGVKVIGIKAGKLTTSYVEGWDVREALGLLSPGFTIAMRRTGGAGCPPLVGDWNGDGDDQLGWCKAGKVATADDSKSAAGSSGSATAPGGDVPVVGDWDGDGTDEIGVFRRGQWLLRRSQSAGPPTKKLTFGRKGDAPLVGSWDGKRLGVAVFRDGQWLLRRSLTTGKVQAPLLVRQGRRRPGRGQLERLAADRDRGGPGQHLDAP